MNNLKLIIFDYLAAKKSGILDWHIFLQLVHQQPLLWKVMPSRRLTEYNTLIRDNALQVCRQDLAAGGAKNQKGGHISKNCIGCIQQPGGQTWNGRAQISNGRTGDHCPTAGDGPDALTLAHPTLINRLKPWCGGMPWTLCLTWYSVPVCDVVIVSTISRMLQPFGLLSLFWTFVGDREHACVAPESCRIFSRDQSVHLKNTTAWKCKKSGLRDVKRENFIRYWRRSGLKIRINRRFL